MGDWNETCAVTGVGIAEGVEEKDNDRKEKYGDDEP